MAKLNITHQYHSWISLAEYHLWENVTTNNSTGQSYSTYLDIMVFISKTFYVSAFCILCYKNKFVRESVSEVREYNSPIQYNT